MLSGTAELQCVDFSSQTRRVKQKSNIIVHHDILPLHGDVFEDSTLISELFVLLV